jgi:SAM-dependent methyltransferase
MTQVALSDHEFVSRHRKIWAARPELRSVYQDWFNQLLRCVDGLHPIVEIGSGPGFFKEYFPRLISTDVVPSVYIDVLSDACSLPFRPGTVGAFVMVDVLHHLARPLEFVAEAARALRPGGRLAMIDTNIFTMRIVLSKSICADPLMIWGRRLLMGMQPFPLSY